MKQQIFHLYSPAYQNPESDTEAYRRATEYEPKEKEEVLLVGLLAVKVKSAVISQRYFLLNRCD